MNDLVDDVHRLEQAFEDMGTLFRLVQFEFRPADDDLVAELHEILENLLQAERPGATLDEGYVVERETGLERGVLVEHVQQDVGIHALLETDDHAGLAAGRFVIDIGNALDPLVFDHLGDLLDHLPLVDHVRDLADHDRLPSPVIDLDIGL